MLKPFQKGAKTSTKPRRTPQPAATAIMFAPMAMLRGKLTSTFRPIRRMWVYFAGVVLATVLEMLLAGVYVLEACFFMKATVVHTKKLELQACWARWCKACGSQCSPLGQNSPQGTHPSRQPRLPCISVCERMANTF